MKLKIDIDDGSFPIARNLLLWLAKTKISPSQRAVVDVILCQTYGFYEHTSQKQQKLKRRKVKAQIPAAVFIKHTWLDKYTLCRAIRSLKKKNIIIQDKSTQPCTYSFNVEVQQWAVDIFRKQLSNLIIPIADFDNESCQNNQQ